MALCFGVVGAACGLARQARLRTTTQVRLCTTTTTTTKTKRGKFEKVYKMTGRGEECAASVSVRGHRILTDTPKLSGGKDGAAQPVELVLAALIGCETATAHFVARQLGVTIDRVDFEVEAVRDVRGAAHVPVDAEAPAPARLQRIVGEARVTSADPAVDDAVVARLAAIVHARCPVADMIAASGCALDVAWRLR